MKKEQEKEIKDTIKKYLEEEKELNKLEKDEIYKIECEFMKLED